MRPELISQPITGICSFGRYPICLDLDELKADFGVLGVPFDMGVGFLSGARMGPRRIREASTQYGRGTAGYYDYEHDEQLLAAPKGEPRRPTFIVKDVRLFLNTVTRGLDLMRSAGVNAQYAREDTEDSILLTIHIPRRPAP